MATAERDQRAHDAGAASLRALVEQHRNDIKAAAARHHGKRVRCSARSPVARSATGATSICSWISHRRVRCSTVAVLISPDELEGLEETVGLLADDQAPASLRCAATEDEAGQAEVLTYQQARERFRAG
jgi:hypothetical protein